MVGIGVIGYGYWGPNLVRNFAKAKDCHVSAVCDRNPEKLALAKRRYPHLRTRTSVTDLLSDSSIDAVVIATPVQSHFNLALAALREGKHVLIEKPVTQTSEQAARLIEETARRNLTLMVGHTFVYTGAVRKIREILWSEAFGDTYYYDSVRVNLGLFQHDVNVLWDLAVHDLCILDHLISERPVAVSATGMSHVPCCAENIAYLTVFYETRFIAHIAVNWLAPVKVRQILIGGSNQMILYNDLEPREKVKVYQKGITLSNSMTQESVHHLIGYRTGEAWAPEIDTSEALSVEAAHFLECVQTGRKPITDGQAGLRVVGVLEAATHSLQRRGGPVELDPGIAP